MVPESSWWSSFYIPRMMMISLSLGIVMKNFLVWISFFLSLFLSLFQYFSLSNSGNNIFLTFGYLNFSFSFVVVMIVTSRYHHHHHHVNPQYHQRQEEERNRIYPTLFPDFFPSQKNFFFVLCVIRGSQFISFAITEKSLSFFLLCFVL